jgi:type I restriction enzyme S subunit
LGDVATFYNGRAYSQHELLAAGTPVLRIQNLNGGDRWYYSTLALEAEKYCGAGDLLYAWSATFGPYRYDGPRAIFHYHIWKVVPQAALDQSFAYYLLDRITAEVKEAAHGVAMPHMTKAGIEAWPVSLPPLGQQRRIAAKLDDLLARSRRVKEALDAIPPLLEKLRQSVLAAAFRGDLTASFREKNPDVEPAEKLLARIRVERRKKWEEAEVAKMKAKGKVPGDDHWKAKYVEPEPVDASDLPGLPEGWCWAGLSEIAEIQLGQRRAPEYADDATYPYIRAANITWRGLDLSDVKTMGFADPESLFLEPGDVLLNEASGSPTEVGKAVLWRGEIPRCCFQATVVRVRAAWLPLGGPWLQLALLRDALVGNFVKLAPGIGVLHLTAERLRSWPVPLAPAEEQGQLTAIVQSVLERWLHTEDQVQVLRDALPKTGAALLAKAFRGELVPQDPNDEPAEAMLARLRATAGAEPTATPARRRTKKTPA